MTNLNIDLLEDPYLKGQTVLLFKEWNHPIVVMSLSDWTTLNEKLQIERMKAYKDAMPVKVLPEHLKYFFRDNKNFTIREEGNFGFYIKNVENDEFLFLAYMETELY